MSENTSFLFGKKNYMLLITGLVLISLGFILMTGGGLRRSCCF